MFAITIRERSGQVYTFHFDKPEVCIGRVKGNDVILPKQNISKRHTLIKVHGDRFVVEDQGSTNGTYVNGHRISHAVEIGPDDKVYLGDFVMNFVDLTGAGATEPPPPPEPMLEAAAADDPKALRATQHMDNLPGLDEILAAAAEADAIALGAGAGDAWAMPGDLPPLPDEGAELAAMPELPPALDALLAADLPPPPIEPLDMPSEIMPLRPLPDLGAPPAHEIEERLTGPIVGLQQAIERSSALHSLPSLSAAIKPPPPPQRPSSGGHTASLLAAQSGLHKAAPAEPIGTLDDAALLFRDAMRELRASVPADPGQMSEQDWNDLEQQVLGFVERRQAAGTPLPGAADQVARDLIYELAGYGPLEPLLDDAGVDAMEIVGPGHLFVVRRGERQRSEQRFSCAQALLLTVDRLARAAGHSSTKGLTSLDATMDDGTQLQVVWPPVAPQGPLVTLRKPRSERPDLEALVNRGWLTADTANTLRNLIAAGRSIAVVGLPGNGRRTLQNALAHLLDERARLVVVEDGQRLLLDQPGVVRVDAAACAGSEGGDALQLGMRLRPDWLLFSESDAVSLATLLEPTADDRGSWIGTFVGRDAQDFCTRMEHALLLRHPGLDVQVARSRVHRALDVIAAFEPGEQGKRELRLYAHPRWDNAYWAMNLP